MFNVNSVSNRPVTQFFQAQPEVGLERDAAQQQIPKKSAVPTQSSLKKAQEPDPSVRSLPEQNPSIGRQAPSIDLTANKAKAQSATEVALQQSV